MITEDMERSEFEDQWRKAFEGGEAEPSDQSWSAIESQLIAGENRQMRGKVVFYQRLAAASLIFAALVSAMGFYYWRNSINATETLAALNQTTTGSQSNVDQQSTALKNSMADAKPANPAVVDRKDNFQPGKSMKSAGPLASSEEKSFFIAGSDNPRNEDAPTMADILPYDVLAGKTVPQETSLAAAESPVKVQKPEETIKVPELADPKEEELKKENEPKKYKEDLWAAVNLSAGNYTPGSFGAGGAGVGPPTAPIIARGVSPINTQSPVGSAYSVGFGIGKRVASRWMVLSGLNYINQSLGYTSNMVANSANQTQAYLKNFATTNSGSTVTFTSPYQINSVLEFVSIPVQAGYLIVDRKLGFQVNGGVASDFLLRSTLQDQSGQAAKLSQGPGDESPYRSVNFAGLLSTELSLRLSSVYRISVVPGIRYMFNPIMKSGTSNPYVTDIGFRFRYIIK